MDILNIAIYILCLLLAQVILSFGMIALWNPILRASRADNVLVSLKNELHWLVPTYLIIKTIESSIIVSFSFTRNFIEALISTIQASTLATIFVLLTSYTLKSIRQNIL